MAVSVDLVYKTVLLILNKEQRGYMTPDEFNKSATQAQLEIFEKYFDDLNVQLRIPESDNEYADRIRTIEDNIAIFQERQVLSFNGTSYFNNSGVDIHRLGSVQYEPTNLIPVEIQQMTQREYLESARSPIAKPSEDFPALVKRGNQYFVYPTTIVNNVVAYFIRKPNNPNWGYTVNPINGAFINDTNTTVNFELSDIEQTELVFKILMYAGVIVRDPQIVQTAASMVTEENQTEKT